jgi:hypothetical protein
MDMSYGDISYLAYDERVINHATLLTPSGLHFKAKLDRYSSLLAPTHQ